MLANDVIDLELRRLIKLTSGLAAQVQDLTTRLEAVETFAADPSRSPAAGGNQTSGD